MMAQGRKATAQKKRENDCATNGKANGKAKGKAKGEATSKARTKGKATIKAKVKGKAKACGEGGMPPMPPARKMPPLQVGECKVYSDGKQEAWRVIHSSTPKADEFGEESWRRVTEWIQTHN